MLGGLITKSTSTIERKVPYLADIPILGQLFRYDSTEGLKRELLIILTPYVIRGPEDSERIKYLETARMNWCCSDVHAIHGVAGLCDITNCGICAQEVPAFYPDFDPQGVRPLSSPPGTEPLQPNGEAVPAVPRTPALFPPQPTSQMPQGGSSPSDQRGPASPEAAPASSRRPTHDRKIGTQSRLLHNRNEEPFREGSLPMRHPITQPNEVTFSMATRTSRQISGLQTKGHLVVVFVCLVAAFLAGCTEFDTHRAFNWFEDDDEPVTPKSVTAMWTDTVMYQPAQSGTRGLGGRFHFFAEDEEKPVLVDGTLTIYAFDGDKSTAAVKPERKFIFLPEQLSDHQSPSTLGPSYSFWLPWDAAGGPQRTLSLIAQSGIEGRQRGRDQADQGRAYRYFGRPPGTRAEFGDRGPTGPAKVRDADRLARTTDSRRRGQSRTGGDDEEFRDRRAPAVSPPHSVPRCH